MPTPLGHGMGGLIAGWTIGGVNRGRHAIAHMLTLAIIGMAPDLDLLVGRHRAESHSVGAALIVASVAAWRRWPVGTTRSGIWWTTFGAWGSHVLFDALGADSGPPIGIMAFWPLSTDYVKFPWDLFLPVSRQWREPEFLAIALSATVWEILLLVPVLVLLYRWGPARRYANSST